MSDPGRSRHARLPYPSVLKTRDFPRSLDRVGVVCLAIAVLETQADTPPLQFSGARLA